MQECQQLGKVLEIEKAKKTVAKEATGEMKEARHEVRKLHEVALVRAVCCRTRGMVQWSLVQKAQCQVRNPLS